jgi:AraC family transcriptional regulator
MHVEWPEESMSDPFLFRRMTALDGLTLLQAHVRAGCAPFQITSAHEINLTSGGPFTTRRLSSGGREITTRTNRNLCVSPAGQTVSAEWRKPLKNIGLLLEPEFVVRTARENELADDFEIREIYRGEDVLIEQLALAILTETEKSEESRDGIFVASLQQTLTLHFIKNYTSGTAPLRIASGGLAPRDLRRIREFIDAHLADELTLADLASVAGLSQFHFARAFRQTTGLSPHQFVLRARVNRARHLLKNAKLTLVEVGLICGFKSQSHFTTVFRRMTNSTPSAWRKAAHR